MEITEILLSHFFDKNLKAMVLLKSYLHKRFTFWWKRNSLFSFNSQCVNITNFTIAVFRKKSVKWTFSLTNHRADWFHEIFYSCDSKFFFSNCDSVEIHEIFLPLRFHNWKKELVFVKWILFTVNYFSLIFRSSSHHEVYWGMRPLPFISESSSCSAASPP